MNPSFWYKKKVFITGHTGFKGSWLSLWLQKHGAILTGYSIGAPTNPNLFEMANVAGEMASVEGNVCNLPELQEAIDSACPDIVIHMAAQALVRESYKDPVGTYATNIMGTVNVLEASRHSESARVVIIVTSDKCYENRERVLGYRENEPMGGYDPYSSSKGCAELVTASYRQSFFSASSPNNTGGATVASVRAGNVIGGGDWAKDRLVPDIMQALLDGRATVIRNPNAVRPWQHVLEPLNGYLMLAERLWEDTELAGAWNFGPSENDTRSVSQIMNGLVRHWGQNVTWEQDSSIQPHEAYSLTLDCSKARQMLGWKPVLPLDKALKWIVEWYTGYQCKLSVRKITLHDIDRYETMTMQESTGTI